MNINININIIHIFILLVCVCLQEPGNGRNRGCIDDEFGGGVGSRWWTTTNFTTASSTIATIGDRRELLGGDGGSPPTTTTSLPSTAFNSDGAVGDHDVPDGAMISRSVGAHHGRRTPNDNNCGMRRFRWYGYTVALFAIIVLSFESLPTTAAVDDEDTGGGSGSGDGLREAYRCGTSPYQPLTEPKGVITTPEFPGPFPVPIDCEWVIQADQAVGGTDGTIIEVYFTQLFVTDGLTITEYSQYPMVFRYATGREVFNKSHIQYGQSMLTTLPYLVIRFRLDRLEGNHIRVHDDLMDVYGFNITYEMRPTGNERQDVCSLYFCSYSGNCLGNSDLT